MKSFVCERCGGNEFRTEKGFRICQHCNTSYVLTSEELPQKTSEIALNNDIQLLMRKCIEDPRNARRYASLILDIDPSNEEAINIFRR